MFWEATPRELFAALDGYFEKSRFAERQEWERARWQTWHLLAPHMDRNHVPDMVKDLPLPWDAENKPPVEIPTEDDFKRIRAKFEPMVKKQMEGI